MSETPTRAVRYPAVTLTVSYLDHQIAREHGVFLLYLDPRMVLRGHAPKVSAVSYRNGATLLCDNELWVRDQLQRSSTKILAEFRCPPHKPGPDGPDIFGPMPIHNEPLSKHVLAVARAYGVWFLYLDPAGPPEDPQVAAVAYRGGKLILRGEEEAVRAKLEHLGIDVVAECHSPESQANNGLEFKP